jgi:protein-tyrosine phosphatase
MFTWVARFGRPAGFILPIPEDYIVTVPEDVVVQRHGRTAFHIHWQETAEAVTIHYGGVVVTVSGVNEAVMGMVTAVHPIFTLSFRGGAWHGRTLNVAERVVPLQKVVNFRDIGGYGTRDGRTVRWGLVFRSGDLSRLNERDEARLQHLGVRSVCDLRSEEEMSRYPDRLPSGLHYWPLPVANMAGRTRWRALHATLFRRDLLHGLMLEGYTRVMVDENAAAVGHIFRLLAEPRNLPLLVHCAAGKDRTGVVIALLLHTLGVPDEVIMADYTMSNLYYRQFKAALEPDIKRLRPLGITADELHAVLIVRPSMLQATFAHIRREYGSVPAYLRQAAGVDDEVVTAVRQNLLRQ